MTQLEDSKTPNGGGLSIDRMPKAALQAIYHAVTGKTERMSKSLSGNVIIKSIDVDRLHAQILQQLEHYQQITMPTITINLRRESSASTQYSSWERFKNIQVNPIDVTSELAIKYEFIIRIPNTDMDQRCIISIGLDSGLPIVHKPKKNHHRHSNA